MRDRLKQCTHDLNNVLGQVLGFSSLLVRDISDANAAVRLPPGLLDYAQELLAAGLRGEVIAKQLTQIVRALPPLPGDVPAAQPTAAQPAAVAEPSRPARRLLIAGVGDGAIDPRTGAFIELGWQVETHRSGADALRRFRASTTPFDAVIAYPSAPEIPGGDLIAAIKALKPKTVCILILGDGASDDVARLAGADGGLAGSASGSAAVAMVDNILRQRQPA